jgi:hypothetical protein
MNCQSIQRHILASEQLDRLPANLARHLSDCDDCRAWHRRLLGIERSLPALPVPPSRGPGALIQQILEAQQAEPGSGQAPSRQLSEASRLREWGRQKLAFAFALAASLLLLALGWWAWPHREISPHEAVARADRRYEERRDLRLREAFTPRQQVAVLANFADDLLREALAIKDQTQLTETVHAYDRLVRNDLIEYAGRIPAQERLAVLDPVADRLRHGESEASRLLAAEQNGPRADSLRAIALAAREGDRQLRALVRAAAG